MHADGHRDPSVQSSKIYVSTLIGISIGLASSFFGIAIVRIPSLNSALIPSVFAIGGIGNAR